MLAREYRQAQELFCPGREQDCIEDTHRQSDWVRVYLCQLCGATLYLGTIFEPHWEHVAPEHRNRHYTPPGMPAVQKRREER